MDKSKQLIYVEETWVSGDTCVFTVPMFERSRAKKVILKMREKFLDRLRNDGFEITYDRNNLPDDTIYLIMDNKAICDIDVPMNIYKKLFDKRMLEAGGEDLNYPFSLSIEEFFNNPFFPAVLKNESTNGGRDKFLIETSEQLEIIKKFYYHFKDKSTFSTDFDCTIFQQLIETPTDYATYMRVLMSASGDVMGASLKYSSGSDSKKEYDGFFEQYFCDENSEYFLDCKSMFNYYSGGENISFCQPRYSSIKQQILEEHGIDYNNPVVPDEVIKAASNIVQKCNRELGIICGLDFIMNNHDGKWYYLENQAFPAIDEWAEVKRIKLPRQGTVDNYLKILEIELEARYEALMLYVNKRKDEAVDKPFTKVLK